MTRQTGDHRKAVNDMAALKVRVGAGAGLVTRRGEAVLFIPEPGENGEALIESFRDGTTETMLDVIAETVVAEGFIVPPFALIVIAGAKVQLRVFGDLEVTTTLATAPMLSGKGSGTWVDHFGALIDEVVVTCGTPADARTDLDAGTVLGGGVELLASTGPAAATKPKLAAEPATVPDVEPETTREAQPEIVPVVGSATEQAVEAETDWAPPPGPAAMPPPPHAIDLVAPSGSNTLAPDAAGELQAELTTFVLEFDDGSVTEAVGSLVLGRKPIVEDVHEVSMPVQGDRVSRTHLRVQLVDGELSVADLDSRNGSVVVWAETGDPQELVADSCIRVGAGDRVVFGSRAFTVREGEVASDD